jgi:hypothetical protein
MFRHQLRYGGVRPMSGLAQQRPDEPKSPWSRIIDHWLMLPPLVFAAIVYFPVTRNYFYIDDFLNLYHIVNDPPLQYLLRENGGHVLLARNTLFYLTFQAVGPAPELYYWCAFLTHLLNVGLLFLVIRRLTDRAGLASFGAALWGTSPLNEGTLGWYSVYGHALVGTTLLIVLAQAARLARSGRPPSRRTRIVWAALALLGATSFGTGVALAMALPFALYLLLPRAATRRPPLLALVVVVPLVYVGLTRFHESVSGVSAPVRVIVSNILSSLPDSLMIAARVTGVGVTRWLMSFYFSPTMSASAWYAVLGGFALLVAYAAWRSPTVQRRQITACVLLAASCYGLIAVARSLLQFWPDSVIATVTRYHYAPTIPLTILLCIMLAGVARRLSSAVRAAFLVAWYGVAVAGYLMLGPVIDHHDIERQQTQEVLSAVRAGAAAQPPGSTVRITNMPFRPFPLYSFVPGSAAAFTMFYADDLVDGRHIVFVEANPEIITMHAKGRRIARLLVSPE